MESVDGIAGHAGSELGESRLGTQRVLVARPVAWSALRVLLPQALAVSAATTSRRHLSAVKVAPAEVEVQL